jgi:hypothetical protein
LISHLRDNLAQAQARFKKYADLKRSERTFNVGDMVYLKFQPYRRAVFGLRTNLKLATRYYGPYLVLQKIGQAAYTLQLPPDAQIHPIFHVSQLKKHLGPKAVPSPTLPMVTPDGYVKMEPEKVLSTRSVPSGMVVKSQWLIQWLNFVSR